GVCQRLAGTGPADRGPALDAAGSDAGRPVTGSRPADDAVPHPGGRPRPPPTRRGVSRVHRRTRIWPLLSRARTVSTPVFLDPGVTVVTSRVPASLVATPRGSVVAVTAGAADGTKHV